MEKRIYTPVDIVRAFSAGDIIARHTDCEDVDLWLMHRNGKVYKRFSLSDKWVEDNETSCNDFNIYEWWVM